MKKNICFNYKYDSEYKQRARLLKAIGFDGVFLYSQYNPRTYVDDILKVGLEIETLHLPYKKYENGKYIDSQFVNVFWTGGSDFNGYLNELLNEIDFANSVGIKSVVMHITGGDAPPPLQESGVDAVSRVFERCNKYGITLCLENLRRLDYLKYVFSAIKDKRLKFCFDSGHANVMTHNIDTFPWDDFGQRLFCVHLNDNDGEKDSHQLPFTGNIKWESLLANLMHYLPNLNLTLEVRVSTEQKQRLVEEEYLQQAFNSLLMLEKLAGANT